MRVVLSLRMQSNNNVMIQRGIWICLLLCAGLAAWAAQEGLPEGASAAASDAADVTSTEQLLRELAGRSAGLGSVRVVQDERIGQMLERYRKQNDAPVIPGFRIRIFSAAGNNARRQALEEMQHFSETYPGVVPYLSYDEPYFKLYVGDFRIKTDALRFLRQVTAEYPHAFISADNIRVRPAAPEETVLE